MLKYSDWRIAPVLALWLALCAPGFAAPAAQPVVLWEDMPGRDLAHEVEYLEDPSGAMKLEEAMSPENAHRYRKSTRAGGDLNFGFSESTYWLRLQFIVAHDHSLDWLLEIGYPPLDRVEVYTPSLWGHDVEVLGDRQTFAQRAYPHYNLVAPFSLKNGAVQTVYLRVQSEGAVLVPLKIWRPTAFAQSDAVQLCWLLTYLGVLFALAVYNLLLFVAMRKAVYLLYSIFAVSMALAQIAYAGLGYQYLWPAFPEFAHVAPLVTLAIMGLCSCFFIREFLSTVAFPRLEKILLLWSALYLVTIAIGIFLSYNIGVHLGFAVATAVWLTAIIGGIHAIRGGVPDARYFLAAWTVLSVAAIIFSLRIVNVLESNWLTTYALQLGSACEMMLLAFALAARVNNMRRDKELAQEQALRTKEEMVTALQRNERELEARIEQRTEELAQANRRLRESQEHLQRLVHHDALTGLANRVLLYDRIDHALSLRRRDGGMLAVLLIDLDDFKPINDRYGHAMGDQLLVAIAHRFEALMRETDTVARLGGDEFVVLLEQVADIATVDKIEQKLRSEAARSFEIQGYDLHVSASIGAALYPLHGSDAQTLLAQADADMYAEKPGRPTETLDSCLPGIRASIADAC